MIFDGGIAEAIERLDRPECAALFSGVDSLLGATASDILRTYQRNGFITYGTTYTANGGGRQIGFGEGRRNRNGRTNIGGVTSYANAQYSANGVVVSVNRIALNVEGFVFTQTIVDSAGNRVNVRNAQPSAFGGLSVFSVAAAAIIHELAHALNVIPQDGRNSAQSMRNSDEVRALCFN